MLSALRHITNLTVEQINTPEGADCTCGQCYKGWYSPRMGFLVTVQAAWVQSFLSFAPFSYSSVRGKKFTKKDLEGIPDSMLPPNYPTEGYVKSFLNGYAQCFDHILACKDTPPFVNKLAVLVGSYGGDGRQFEHFIEKDGKVEWALGYCLNRIKNNYTDLLKIYFDKLQNFPVCNNDWKVDLVQSTLFLQPAEQTNATREQQKLLERQYKQACKTMKNFKHENDPPAFQKPTAEIKKCDHPNEKHPYNRKVYCLSCSIESFKDNEELEREAITFTTCQHPEKPRNYKGMCERCHLITKDYPIWWKLDRSKDKTSTQSILSPSTPLPSPSPSPKRTNKPSSTPSSTQASPVSRRTKPPPTSRSTQSSPALHSTTTQPSPPKSRSNPSSPTQSPVVQKDTRTSFLSFLNIPELYGLLPNSYKRKTVEEDPNQEDGQPLQKKQKK